MVEMRLRIYCLCFRATADSLHDLRVPLSVSAFLVCKTASNNIKGCCANVN